VEFARRLLTSRYLIAVPAPAANRPVIGRIDFY
jgi:hypothetical protein